MKKIIFAHFRRAFFQAEFYWDLMALLVLGSFAFAQPLLDLLGQNPEFFVASGARGREVFLFAIYLSFLFTPQFFFPWVLVAGLAGRSARKVMHVLLLATFSGIILLPVLKQTEFLGPRAIFALAGGCGILFAVGYLRFNGVRLFVKLLTPAVIIFQLLFFMTPQIKGILFPEEIVAEASSPVAKNPLSIVFVLFDEFNTTGLLDENREIDRAAFPNFAMLADDGYWFRNATTVSAGTTYAIPAILSGKFIARNFVLPNWQNYPNNLFLLLAKTHRMRVAEGVTNLCPRQLCPKIKQSSSYLLLKKMLSDAGVILRHILLPEEISKGIPAIDMGWANFTTLTKVAPEKDNGINAKGTEKELFREAFSLDKKMAFEKMVAGIEGSENPTVHFLHFLFPHRHYKFMPSGKRYRRNQLEPTIRALWKTDQQAVNVELQRYMFQLGYADRMVGNLVAKLKEEGLYERTLLIITSDHGVGFEVGKHNRRLTETNYFDLLPTPLFIKVPGVRRNGISNLPAESVDILPTIADVMQLELPSKPDGTSLLSPNYPQKTTRTVHDHAGSFKNYDLGEFPRQTFPVDLPTENDLLAQKSRLFGRSDHPEKYFRYGSFRGLIGKAPEDFHLNGPKELSLKVEHLSDLTDFMPHPHTTPSQVFGTLADIRKGAKPLDIAMSVNGIIQGVTRTLAPTTDKKISFAIFFPERVLKQGANVVDFYLISKSGLDEITLTKILHQGQPSQ